MSVTKLTSYLKEQAQVKSIVILFTQEVVDEWETQGERLRKPPLEFKTRFFGLNGSELLS